MWRCAGGDTAARYCDLSAQCNGNVNQCNVNSVRLPIQYTMNDLMTIRDSVGKARPDLNLPPEIKPRKRGRKGGVRARNKRLKFKPFLPSAVIGNVRALKNKMDELHTKIRYIDSFRTASVICLCETWLNDDIPDSHVSLSGFELFRADRDDISAEKDGGGGLCTYINTNWCHPNNASIKHKYCSPDLEMLTVNIRPYYLPREFSHVIVVNVYVPQKSSGKRAAEHISAHVHDLMAKSPDAVIIITGDFNHCSLNKGLPTFQQQVSCRTRGQATLDLFYSNIKNSYSSTAMPPLGSSDHDLIHLLPRYRPVVQRVKPTTCTVKVWSKEAWDTLQGCFDCTDWSVFQGDVHHLADTVGDYINFCVDTVIPTKAVKIYPNSKPWVTGNIKQLLNKESQVFREGNREKLKEVQREVKNELRKGKLAFREKIEKNFESNDMKKVWKGLGEISGRKQGNARGIAVQSDDYADQLNQFYARFDCHDFSTEREEVKDALMHSSAGTDIECSEEEVLKVLKKTKPGKAPGPDGVMPGVLRVCAEQLCSILTRIFNMSLQACQVPSAWKTSSIIPVPKKKVVSVMNDLRPVALTSCVMKVFERVVLVHLQKQVADHIDPLQFAYRSKRGVEDAVLHVLNNVYSHLEKKGSSIRLIVAAVSHPRTHDTNASDIHSHVYL